MKAPTPSGWWALSAKLVSVNPPQRHCCLIPTNHCSRRLPLGNLPRGLPKLLPRLAAARTIMPGEDPTRGAPSRGTPQPHHDFKRQSSSSRDRESSKHRPAEHASRSPTGSGDLRNGLHRLRDADASPRSRSSDEQQAKVLVAALKHRPRRAPSPPRPPAPDLQPAAFPVEGSTRGSSRADARSPDTHAVTVPRSAGVSSGGRAAEPL